jgi:hypothetical protein
MVICPPTVLPISTLMAASTGTISPTESFMTEQRKDVLYSKSTVKKRLVKRNSLVTVLNLLVYSFREAATFCATAEQSSTFQATQCLSKFTVPDQSRLTAVTSKREWPEKLRIAND